MKEAMKNKDGSPDIRGRFCKKLYEELNEFKREMMHKSKKDIFESSYKTEVFINLYEILTESADKFSDALLYHLVSQSTSILESLYEDFVTDSGEDTMYEDLKDHVMQRFEDEEDSDWWDRMPFQAGA
jgi:hypothetical protein